MLDPRPKQLITDMIRTERSRRGVPADKAMVAIRDDFTRRGTLGHGRLPLLLDEAAAAEYEGRAQLWLGIASRVVSELGVPWTEGVAKELLYHIRTELANDWSEIYTRLERFAKASRGIRIDQFEAGKNRADRHLEQELELLVLRQDRTRLPLTDRLSAERYRTVGEGWKKAHTLLAASPPDLANAVKEAVGAVEALARIVTAQPSATLGEAIKILRVSSRITPPLLRGLEELWGWTSEEPGVRHAVLEGPMALGNATYCMSLAEAGLGLLLNADAT
jgi:hypothetical protein